MRTRVVAVVFATVVVAGVTLGATDPPPTRIAPHGAQVMADQIAAFDALKTDVTGEVIPTDRAYWNTLVPEDNAATPARIALGKKLYFDPRLSRDGTVACATCHDVSRGFTDRRPASEGIGGRIGRRNAPTTLNAAFFSSQFWDGRAKTLEDQARLPPLNPVEMGQPNGDAVVAVLTADADYPRLFHEAYGHPPNYEDFGRAIGAFERTLIFLDAPFDRFMNGQVDAIDDDAKAGMVLFFGKARCASCHTLSAVNPVGTDNRFHNIGVSARHQDFEKLARQAVAALDKTGGGDRAVDELALSSDLAELGRFVVTKHRSDIGAFKTEQLRNVGLTPPYMHDGSMQTLWDVVDHYNKGGEANPYLDGGIEPLDLSEQEVNQLVAFMFTLTDARFADDNRTQFNEQRAKAQKSRPFRDDELAHRTVLPFQQRLAREDRAAGSVDGGTRGKGAP